VVGGAELGSQGTTTATTATSHIAFSDVKSALTPYAGYSFLPANPNVGVIVFTMLTNEGSPITNVTSQQFRALVSTGKTRLSSFTGNSSDTSFVFATGRNDGSGTRTIYLAETGAGVTGLVKQYIANQSTSEALTTIQLTPEGGVNVNSGLSGQDAANRSTVWGQDVAGNGGYNSGSNLATAMGKTSAAVTVLDENGEDAFGDPVSLNLVTFLSLSDAVTARNAGAIFCSFNGEKLSDIAASGSSMSDADKAKVTNGKYTAWGYEVMYRRNDITSGDALTVYDGLKAAIPNNLGTAGIKVSDMVASRETDGGTVGF
jgi:hypothetical protein